MSSVCDNSTECKGIRLKIRGKRETYPMCVTWDCECLLFSMMSLKRWSELSVNSFNNCLVMLCWNSMYIECLLVSWMLRDNVLRLSAKKMTQVERSKCCFEMVCVVCLG